MRYLHAILLVLFAPITAGAQVELNSLNAVFTYADEHAPTAGQARLQSQMAKDDKQLAASGLYPRINAFSTADYYPLIPTQVIPAEIIGGAPGTFLKAQFGLPYVFTAGAEVSMPVVNFEKWAQLSKIKAQYDKELWSSKAALEGFHIQLAQVYYRILVTKEVLALNVENTKTAEELLRIMNDRYNAGVLNPADNNRTKNLQADVQTTQINYERELRQSINLLASLLSLPKDSLVITAEFGSFEWPMPQVAQSPTSRPAWQEANLQVRVAELALNESKYGALPKLSLNGRYAYNMQSKLEAGGSNVEFNVANVGVRLDLPLFQGNYYRVMRHKANLQLKWAQLDRKRVEASVTQQNSDWFAQYAAAFEKRDILKRKVASASDNLRIANLNIKEGVMEFDEYNNIFTEYNRARIEYLQNLADGVLYHLLSTQNL